MKKVLAFAVVVLVGSLASPGIAQAADRIHKSFDIPAELVANIQASACSAAPGPQIALQGDLTLSGLNVETIFRNTGPAVPQEPIVVQQVVVPAQDQVSTPTQSIVGGLGDNPYMWLQILDGKGKVLTSEIFLGRCDQATFTTTAALMVPADALGDAFATGCSAASPTVSLEGETRFSALTARLIFRSDNVGHPKGQVNQSISEIVIVPEGQAYPLPTQPVSADIGTNPQVSVQFRGADGNPIASESRLGRCSSLVAP